MLSRPMRLKVGTALLIVLGASWWNGFATDFVARLAWSLRGGSTPGWVQMLAVAPLSVANEIGILLTVAWMCRAQEWLWDREKF